MCDLENGTVKEDSEFFGNLFLIKRGSEELISELELIEKLKNKKQLIIKAGFDPTAPDIHLGHTVLLRKLKHFQSLGHQVVLLIGDFTAMIGDPTGKSETRKKLSPEEVKKNAETYTDQVFKILDKFATKVVFNSQWCEGMSFAEVLALTSKYTVARMLERDDFQKRYSSRKPISMTELMYPLIQGYDSVKLKADVELGGTDQKFNLLVGRQLMKESGLVPQVILTMPILEGLDGVQKMSKSLNNYIGINDLPNEMFGKIMSIPDALIFRYFTLLTEVAEEEIKEMDATIKKGANPRDIKVKLAKKIISVYHPPEAGDDAEKEFNRIFSQGGIPSDITEIEVQEKKLWVVDLIARTGHLKSNGDIRRLIKQGGIKIDDEKITDDKASVLMKNKAIIKIGKRGFYVIKLKS